MNKEQIISQLCSLREHCGSMIDKDEPDSVGAWDVEALSTAIDAMKGEKPMTQIILWAVGIVGAVLATVIILVCMIVGDDRRG